MSATWRWTVIEPNDRVMEWQELGAVRMKWIRDANVGGWDVVIDLPNLLVRIRSEQLGMFRVQVFYSSAGPRS